MVLPSVLCKEVTKEQSPERNLYPAEKTSKKASSEYKCCKSKATVLGKKFSWINQHTRLFHHNERAVFCWLSLLSQLNFGPLFSPSPLDGVMGGVRCTLLIRVYFYSLQEYFI